MSATDGTGALPARPSKEHLRAYRARHDIPDKLWGGKPLDWAIHGGHAHTRARLEELEGQAS